MPRSQGARVHDMAERRDPSDRRARIGPRMDDREILKRFRTGNREDAFRMLVDAYKTMTYNIIYQMVHDPSVADDLSQETFLRVWRGLPHFRSESKLSTWIYRIAKNVTYSELKSKHRRYRMLPLDGDREDEEVPKLVDERPSAEEQVAREDTGKHVHGALAQVPERYRMALNLYYFLDKSYEEVAAIMEIPLGTVKTFIHRGKAKLSKALEAEQVSR